jgi:hypothetical protein
MLARLLPLLMLACCGARAFGANAAPVQFLDERTGATVTVVREPLVFALERSILAANSRDYINMTAVEVDRSGHIQLYLIGYFWSTIDRRGGAHIEPAQRPLELSADGRLIRLTPEAEFPKDLLDDKQLKAPTFAKPQRAAYLITREVLRYIVASKKMVLSFASETDSEDPQSAAAQDDEREIYEAWDDGRKALKAFLEHIDY